MFEPFLPFTGTFQFCHMLFTYYIVSASSLNNWFDSLLIAFFILVIKLLGNLLLFLAFKERNIGQQCFTSTSSIKIHQNMVLPPLYWFEMIELYYLKKALLQWKTHMTRTVYSLLQLISPFPYVLWEFQSVWFWSVHFQSGCRRH